MLWYLSIKIIERDREVQNIMIKRLRFQKFVIILNLNVFNKVVLKFIKLK